MSRLCLPVHMNDFPTEEKATSYADELRREKGWAAEVRHYGKRWEVWA